MPNQQMAETKTKSNDAQKLMSNKKSNNTYDMRIEIEKR